MEFINIKVVEDRSNGNKINFNKNTFYAGPMKIQDIEFFENVLLSKKVPYKLVECETTVESLNKEGSRFAKGYCLFTKFTGTNKE